MKKLISILGSFIFGFLLLASEKPQTKVITYPAPPSERVESIYKVFVNGQEVDIYKALSPMFKGGEYYFCYFDFEGQVDVKVECINSFGRVLGYTITDKTKRAEAQATLVSDFYPPAKYYPAIKNVKRSLKDITFSADKPFQAVVIRDSAKPRDMPLVIFGNPLEKNPPKQGDKDVVYFGAGVHCPKERINIKSGQTLYVAGGAVLKAQITVLGKNCTVRGRGIVSWDNRGRNTGRNLKFDYCHNLKVEGLIFKDPSSWTFVIEGCNKVEIDNIKICASRMINDDAIDIVNSKNVVIKNSFARAQDDIIAIKGMPRCGKVPCENIYIENCVLWVDIANIFRVGYECFAPYFKNIKAKNIYVPFYSTLYRDPPHYWSQAVVWVQPTTDMKISDVHIENMHVRADGRDMPLIIAEPRIVHLSKTFGSAQNITLKNVVVEGTKGNFRGQVWVAGQNENATIENVKVENVSYFGKKQTTENKLIHVGGYTKNISIFEK